jgi:hypothetical protein
VNEPEPEPAPGLSFGLGLGLGLGVDYASTVNFGASAQSPSRS